MKVTSKKLVLIGLFIAIGVILTRFASLRIPVGGIEGIRIGVGPLAIILAGILFGPFYGSLTGVMVDVIGYILSPIGPYMPHFTLTSALYGLIPGIMSSQIISHYHEFKNLPKLLIWGTVSMTQILVGFILTPIFLHLIFDIPWKLLIVPRLISTPIQVLLFGFILQLLYKAPPFSSLFFSTHQSR
ncbi:MAG TPA: folate family ECF transporter S component [Candidatus Atribacteria bacterium]|nr:folate family ECF transporter S component [Candidatus Atribacteria bacterium]